ncbi:DoxX family protein [Massilia sp. 9096]|uniref:DoxX family protein n=1 Tax=Massilia sp. 9096 TaxID=1500894 RepID=UPI0005625ACE|nr:DoxX family protein [Massilia sp. 9096]
MTAAAGVVLVARLMLVALFMPSSVIDKTFGFDHAVRQAQEVFKPRIVGVGAILAGLVVELGCSLGVLTGVADRACAFVIAGFCMLTAILYKRFWAQGDFWADPDGHGRTLFWDFMKNLSLAGAFLLIVVGTDGSGLAPFLDSPLASSQPYRSHP